MREREEEKNTQLEGEKAEEERKEGGKIALVCSSQLCQLVILSFEAHSYASTTLTVRPSHPGTFADISSLFLFLFLSLRH